jgi:hypothetical protein
LVSEGGRVEEPGGSGGSGGSGTRYIRQILSWVPSWCALSSVKTLVAFGCGATNAFAERNRGACVDRS